MNESYFVTHTFPEDLGFICKLFEGAIAYQKRNSYPGWNDYDKNFLEKEIRQKLQYKIVHDGHILCVFSVCFADPLIWRDKDKGTSIYLHRVVVNPAFKGQSLFTKVLNWAIDYAKNNQLDTIRIDTWADNDNIINYYKRFGFVFLENYTTSNSTDLPVQHRNLNVALMEYKVTS